MNNIVDHINLKYKLIKCFLQPIDKGALDISYIYNENYLNIQIIILEGFSLSKERRDIIENNLAGFNVNIIVHYLSKDQFNESKDQWVPINYERLKNLLFSKAEVL